MRCREVAVLGHIVGDLVANGDRLTVLVKFCNILPPMSRQEMKLQNTC